MFKAALVGAAALAAVGFVSVPVSPASAQDSAAQISQVKSMLRLTPEQERHWPPVEAALRSLIRKAAAESGNDGIVQRVKNRASDLASHAAAVRRVVSAARPLMRVLDDSQKQTARSIAGSYGGAHLASAL